jgi:regulatory protein
MIISSVERNKKNKDRLSVYVDNQYSFSISEADYLSLNLYELQEITNEEIINIKEKINFRSAKATAIRYVSLKFRSEKEVAIKLENEGYDIDTISKVIEGLRTIGYVNDTLYVQKYIFDRYKLKPRSKKMLKYELLSRGIKKSIIDEALNEWKVDDCLIAEKLVKRKFGKYDLNDEKIIKKVYSFLLHRGFNYETVSKAINNINERTV